MENKTPIIIIGTGAEARIALDITTRMEVLVYGFFSLEEESGIQSINDMAIITHFGSDDANALLAQEEIQLVLAVSDVETRQEIVEELDRYRRRPINLVDPSAVISPHAKMGNGNLLSAGVVLHANSVLGDMTHLHTGATLEPDAVVGDYCTIQAGARLGKGAFVGYEANIGMGAIIYPGIEIGPKAIVAPGAVVLKSVSEEAIVKGNPAS
jgi:sugar O-acyltransferase (sialic acid O-acetyltransferase NeuD family)